MNKKTIVGERDAILLSLIVVAVLILGILGLYFLQKLSINNKYICNYLGGLWEKKDVDQVHRCYTYEEFYSKP